MRNLKMRIVAVCVVFHIKLRWPKRKVYTSHSFQVTAFFAIILDFFCTFELNLNYIAIAV